jgi:PPP family 3-phenylpropionic acid transporter
VLFAFAARLVHRLGITALLALAALSGVVRWTALAASAELWLLIAVQVLHAGTFAAAHLAAMHFLAQAVPARASASAQALYSAIAAGAGMALAMSGAGALYALAGAGAFLAMAAMAAAGAAAALLLGRTWRGEEITLAAA